MSTKSSLFYHQGEGDHKIGVHIYKDMHESEDTVSMEIRCSTCYCKYSLLMTKHLGEQLADLLNVREK